MLTADGGSAPTGSASRAAAWDRLYDAALDEMTVLLREQAKGWAARLEVLRRMDDLASLGDKAGAVQFPQLEMAGSWNVSQITAPAGRPRRPAPARRCPGRSRC